MLLATCSALPDGEEWAGTNLLLPAPGRARASTRRWVVWDDPASTGPRASSRCARRGTTSSGCEEFLAWARSVPWMLNSAEVFAWNTDKAYLTAAGGAGVPVVPTVVVEREEDLPAAIAEVRTGTRWSSRAWAPAAAGSWSSTGPTATPDLDESDFGPGPWVVQPLVESVRTEGETSVFVLDGEVVSQAQKVPGRGRDPGARGLRRDDGRRSPLTDEAAELARRTVEAAGADPRRARSTTPGSTRCGWPTAPWPSASSR